MTLPTWPLSYYAPQLDSFQPIQRSLDPLATDMEGGNTRERPRPGDNVGTIGQTIWLITAADHNTVVEFVKTSLNLGTARFTMPVWLGSSFVSKTVQFIKPGTGIKYAYILPDVTAMSMTIRVYGL